MRVYPLFILFLIFNITILAQDSILLTFNSTVSLSLKNNTNILNQENNLRISKSNKWLSNASFIPNAYINIGGNRTNGAQFDNTQSTIVNTEINRFNYSINVNYTLFNGFKRLNNIYLAECNHAIQRNQVEWTKQNIIFSVTNQYLQILLNKELIKISQNNLENQKIIEEKIKAQYNLELKSEAELYSQQSQVYLAKVELNTLKNQLVQNEGALIQTLMINPKSKIHLLEPEWEIEKILLIDYDLDSLWMVAKENRADIKMNGLNSKSLEYNIAIAKSNLYPSITLFGSYGSYYQDNGQFSFNTQINEENPSTVIGFSINIPIFNNYSNKHNINTTKINYLNNLNYNIQYEQQVYNQLNNAVNNYYNTKESYKASIIGCNAAEKSFEKATERYNMGIGNIVEYIQANQIYMQAVSKKLQTTYALLFQNLIINYYTGTLKYDEYLE